MSAVKNQVDGLGSNSVKKRHDSVLKGVARSAEIRKKRPVTLNTLKFQKGDVPKIKR